MATKPISRSRRSRLALEPLEQRTTFACACPAGSSLHVDAREPDGQALFAPVSIEGGQSAGAETLTLATLAPAAFQQLESIRLAQGGDGFLVVSDSASPRLFTRRVEIHVDQPGRLITAAGQQVMGYATDDAGHVLSDNLVPLSFSGREHLARRTTAVVFQAVLNPTAPIGHTAASTTPIYDDQGNESSLSFEFRLQEHSDAQSVFAWQTTRTLADGSALVVGEGLLPFDIWGNPVVEQAELEAPFGDPDDQIVLDFSRMAALANTNASGQPISAVSARQGGGFPPGELSRVIVAENGELRGQYSTGFQVILGRLPTAIISNPHGLQEVGEGLYETTPQSGPASLRAETLPGGGLLQLPADYRLLPDGSLVEATAAQDPKLVSDYLSPFHVRYPWLVRETDVSLAAGERLLVQDPSGGIHAERPERVRLNAQRELVTLDGLRVMGRPTSGGPWLAPIVVPVGDSLFSATENVRVGGQIDIDGLPATTRQVVESSVLYDLTTIRAPRVADPDVKLVDLGVEGRGRYPRLFAPGTLTIQADIGGFGLQPMTFTITPETRLGELVEFLDRQLIDPHADGGDSSAGVSLVQGKLTVVSRLGETNAVELNRLSFVLHREGESWSSYVRVPFTNVAEADGLAALAYMAVTDSHGADREVLIWFDLASRSADTLSFRWRASEAGALPSDPSAALGQGVVEFSIDGQTLHADPIQFRLPGSESDRLVTLRFDNAAAVSSDSEQGVVPSYFNTISRDGFKPSVVQTYSIDSRGALVAELVNGRTRLVGRVALVTPRPTPIRDPWPEGRGRVALRPSVPLTATSLAKDPNLLLLGKVATSESPEGQCASIGDTPMPNAPVEDYPESTEPIDLSLRDPIEHLIRELAGQ